MDASNADKYKDRLSEGQMALLKQLKGYKMDVYPTRRSCGYPQQVYDNTRKNATGAKLAEDSVGADSIRYRGGGHGSMFNSIVPLKKLSITEAYFTYHYLDKS